MEKKIRYIFIPFPTRLDGDWLLNEDEKSFLRRLIGLGSKGWFYGDKCLAKRLGIGIYHLRRAKLRLLTLGLIRAEKRGPQNFVYYFEHRLEKWRLPERIANGIREDCRVSLKQGEFQFEREPFKSNQHFESYFAQAYPKFANGRKGRSKENEKPEPFEEDVVDSAQAPVVFSTFLKRIENLKTHSKLRILSEYYRYRDGINSLKTGECESDDPTEILFYEKLELATENILLDHDSELKSVIEEIQKKVAEGESNLSVSNFLDGLARRKKMEVSI